MKTRILMPGDEAALEAFLVRHAATSMFLRSNAQRAGVVDAGERYQGTYAAAFVDEAIVAVACHAWNGMLLLQAPAHLDAVVAAAVASDRRPVAGLIGPWAQVTAARRVLGLGDRPTRMDSLETLFSLALSDLVLPAPLVEGRVVCRMPRERELDRLGDWRADYEVEVTGEIDSPALRPRCREQIAAAAESGDLFVLVDRDAVPVAMAAYNARLPDMVQIGGVYTPPALRGRGHARAVVAGALLAAREAGIDEAILFTGAERGHAQRAYRAIGFEEAGDYGLVLFAEG